MLDGMQEGDSRREPRRHLRLVFRYHTGGDLARTVSSDVSSRGLFLLTEKPLALGQRFTLAPLTEGADCPILLDAWVRWRWTTPTLQRQLTGMGVQLIRARCPLPKRAELVRWLKALPEGGTHPLKESTFEGRSCVEYDFM